MIARVTTLSKDNDALVVTVSYIDNSDPENLVEIASRQFRFTEETTTQQARADIIAAGRKLNEREAELRRLSNALVAGTEFSV